MSAEQKNQVNIASSVENQTSVADKLEHAQTVNSAEVHTPPTVKAQFAELLRGMTSSDDASHDFLLRVVQPGLAGLMDGSISTLAPIFATAFATHRPFTAFLVGIASATGAGISMAFSEALSDNGELTGRGSPVIRGGITGLMTFIGGTLHTLPFLITNLGLTGCRLHRRRYRTHHYRSNPPPLLRYELVALACSGCWQRGPCHRGCAHLRQ